MTGIIFLIGASRSVVALPTGSPYSQIPRSGIGFATVQHLARRGAKVYIATRSEARGRDAVARLHAQGLETVAWHALDLGDPRAAKKSAEEFAKREARLDVLGASCGCWASHTASVRRADNGNVPRPQ